jgi:predicted DNA-binding helix-hairpin-helix protein
MEPIERLSLLSQGMAYEPDGEIPIGAGGLTPPENCPGLTSPASAPALSPRKQQAIYTHNAVMPNGKRIRLLKTLLSSACERQCYYCPFRAGRDFRRATFEPEEFARLFSGLYRSGIAQGLFLSSGILQGGIATQDKLIAAAEILRTRLEYRGYLHLKLMPGAQKAQVERAMQLADRVSVNLEAPNTPRLERLAPGKQFMEELLQPLKWVQEIRRNQPGHLGWKGHWPSSTTQFVAGGAQESDLELLQTTSYLYRKLGLVRAYFSAFKPVPDTPLENQAPTHPLRELRLYQASFLLRDYGFDIEELPFENEGNLPLASDPKLAWAQRSLGASRVEVNRASLEELLRVPGIGPKSARAILSARRQGRLVDWSSLAKLGVSTRRAGPFLLVNGRSAARQLQFNFA